MSGCVFCEKIKDNCPSGVAHFEPLNPVTPGHMLFVPSLHIANAGEAPLIAALVMYEAIRYAAAKYASFNIITSAGAAATQTVMHLHVHVIPRQPGDNLALPWGLPKEE
jgi:histidine triad (HIT) family protein